MSVQAGGAKWWALREDGHRPAQKGGVMKPTLRLTRMMAPKWMVSTPIATPRTVLKEAFAAGVIQDAEEWNKIITARNITSHVYDEKTAEDVAA